MRYFVRVTLLPDGVCRRLVDGIGRRRTLHLRLPSDRLPLGLHRSPGPHRRARRLRLDDRPGGAVGFPLPGDDDD